jgi:hypothetical protein
VKTTKYITIALLLFANWAFAQIPSRRGSQFPSRNDDTPSQNSQSSDGTKSNNGKSGKSIIDDSTKNVYGPKTAQYFFEDDVVNNRKTLYTIDTNYYDFHRYNISHLSNYQYVDLGNLGTAARRLYYKPTDQIGAQLGYDAYSPYAYQINEVKYFDTRSPYTNMYLVLGGLGQNILRFDHSQSLNPRLNFGIQAQRSTANKQYGTSGRSDAQSNLIQNWAFVFHGNYRSENGKYDILGQFNYLNHDALEQGGIVPDSSKIATEGVVFWDNIERSSKLSNASSWERRSQLHVYHQYKMAQGFQLFHFLDYRRDTHIFTDKATADAAKYRFYRNTFYPVAIDNQDVRYHLLENKVGIKGRFKDFNYRLHLRQRIYDLAGSYKFDTIPYKEYTQSRIENFVGVWLNYFLKDSTQRVTLEAEYLAGTNSDFKIKGELVSKWFEAGGSIVSSSPTLLQERFESNHLVWDNQKKLSNVGSLNGYGQANLKYKMLLFNPRIDYSLISNYIYYDTNAVARQFGSPFSVLRISTNIEWRPKRWQIVGQTQLTAISNDVMRAPRFMANLRLSYDFIYSKVLYVQIGTDLHYKTAYFADGYMPLTQQFYLQNQLKTEGYLLADAFANFRINRVRIFVKWANFRHFFSKTFSDSKLGYFSTPFYPGMNDTISFGVNWPLFD